jgi:hypothetical protein
LQSDIFDRPAKVGEPPQSVTYQEDLIGQVGGTARCEMVMTDANSFPPIVTDAGGTKGRRTVRVTEVSGLTMDFSLTPE